MEGASEDIASATEEVLAEGPSGTPGLGAAPPTPHLLRHPSSAPTAGPSSVPAKHTAQQHPTGLSGGSSLTHPESALGATHTQEVEPLASYTCPVCFSPPTYATITPCGHVLCGDCLFTAVKTTIQRGAYTLPAGERMVARCPVCRAAIPGWDGKGGGVIGLRPRAVFSL
ncbi:uncharacterized protein TRAVEDRAFT_125996 [Trametes versicolor FP-101664 SS1]|uniref:uncharacterized protein n=1 Tax=Trametes versicolor (strain FP-101664) TaxID=717944 RepID=UPI00046228D5|nr:uncharacterized protein TRAVEDRAFT_125996 [Trametes versicolor FP-101664 SS1]EIW58017.1 hypothetical protein TRAVEDRAFT_125996 [Trametes versicolor FP-101664 SS1]